MYTEHATRPYMYIMYLYSGTRVSLWHFHPHPERVYSSFFESVSRIHYRGTETVKYILIQPVYYYNIQSLYYTSSNTNTLVFQQYIRKKKIVLYIIYIYILLYLWLAHVNNIYLILHCGEINAVCGDDCSVRIEIVIITIIISQTVVV